jgi:hypothetical protein
MTQQELDFLEQHKINFESVALGFCRNMQHDVLAEYERIYKTYLDKQFVLIYYCGACVFDMVKRLSSYYESFKAQAVQVEVKPTKAKKKQ